MPSLYGPRDRTLYPVNWEPKKCLEEEDPGNPQRRGALAGYCENWATFKSCQAFINAHGLTYEVTNRSGTFYNARPEVTLRDKALEQIRRFAQEFGFSPAARSRIEIPKVETKDLLREALSKPRVIQHPKDR